MDDIMQKVQARLAELPLDVRQAIESADLDARVQAIGKKHQLHIDQMGKLQNEVLLIMLGFEDSGALVGNLTSVVGVPAAQAEALAGEINNEIFAPIRESLKKFSASTAPASAPPPPPAVTAAPPAPPPPPKAPMPAPLASKVPAAPLPASPAPTSKPAVPLAPHPHDLTLVEKTITTPPKTPPAAPTAPTSATPTPSKPDTYTTDPYREPIEP